MSFLPPAAKLNETVHNFETQIEELTESVEEESEYEAAVMKLYKSMYEKINENKTGLIICTVQSLATFVISVFIGLNANKWYYKHTLKHVKKICSETETEKIKEKLFTSGGVAYGPAFLAVLVEKTAFLALELLLSGLM